MREDVERLAPELLEIAEREVGVDPFARLEEGTRYVQPAILCASLAGWRLADEQERPAVLAGHSLGEVAALAAAGSISKRDAVRIVALRGRLMQEAGQAAGDGGMLAVMGGGREQVAPMAAELGLVLANDNGPKQVVLSGARDALARAAERARADGLRPMELPVPGAFHSPAMAGALPAFRAALAEIPIATPRIPVYCSTTAAPFGDDVPADLADGLVSPVRWRDTVEAMHAAGVRRFVEAGPGKVLVGLVRRTLDGVEVATVSRPATAEVGS
jgi:malonyl CoA-acyl carrier protein transacylase